MVNWHKFFTSILDTISDGVFISDAMGTTLYVNQMYADLVGVPARDLRGKNVRDLVSEGFFDLALNPEVVRTGKPATYMQKLKDGKNVVISGSPVFDDKGRVCLVVTFVRDETRLVGGYAQCGQELCCTRFGGQFEPVSIRMAKEQDLPLNSSKISGVCGRLMCCLRYEFEAYKDFKSRAPKKKTLIDTPLGKARIQEYDTPREQLVLRLENGKVFKVNLADMTCSEGCKKKAAEQGCNCRPDCVTRDVLERIESPEMRLALMELDRENGVDVGDGLSSADRLAGTSMPKRRRRDAESDARAGQGQGEGRGRGKGRGKAEAPEAEEAAGARRRRKRAGSGDATEAAAAGKNASREREVQQPQQQNRGGGMNPTRRRRRHLSSEEREDAFRAAAAREAGAASKGPSASDASADKGGKSRGEEERAPRPRRRHSSGAQQKPSVPSVADQVSDGEVKVTRRRPGDGGGAAAKASRGAARDEREPREDRGGEGSADQGQKRRRRRRSRKPRQDGGEGSTPSSSAPQPPAGE